MLNKDLIPMKRILKYIVIGMIVGGSLPVILHPLEITVLASAGDIVVHTASAMVGIVISLIAYRIRNK